MNMKSGCHEIQDKIRLYNMQITENEQKIQKLQEELNVRQEKLNVGRTAYHREASRLESLKNITERYDGYGTVSVKRWQIRIKSGIDRRCCRYYQSR